MASVTLGPVAGWTVGKTISLYARDSRNVKVGAAVTTAVVASNSTTTFSGLDDDARFIASDGTREVRCDTLTGSSTAQSGSGSGIVYGAGAPGSGVGTDGQSYIDTSANRLYGPKVSGAWPGTFIELEGVTQSELDAALDGVVSAGLPAGAGTFYKQQTRPALGSFPWQWEQVNSRGDTLGLYSYDGDPTLTLARDSFTGTADTLATAHSPEVGGPILKQSGSTGNWKISDTGTLYFATGDTTVLYYSASPTTANYSVAADFVAKDASGGAGLMARCLAAADTGILVHTEGTAIKLFEATSGSYTPLLTASATLASGQTKSVELIVNGNQVTLKVAGVSQGTVTTTVLGAGHAGCRGYATGSNTAGTHLDNLLMTEQGS